MNHECVKKGMSKTLLVVCVVLVFGSVSQLFAAEAITGDWEMKENYEHGQSLSMLSISKKADGSLSGKWTGGWGEIDLADLKFENDKLSFSRTFKGRDAEHKSAFTGTLKDGKIAGTVTSERGSFSATAERPVPKPAVLGRWDLTVKKGEKESARKLVVSQDPNGSFRAKWTSDKGTSEVSDVKFKDGKLSFKRKSKNEEKERESTFEGTVQGDSITGTMTNENGQAPVVGKRFGTQLIGKWELTTTNERGERKRQLIVNSDLTGTYPAGFTLAPIKNLELEGNNVTFKIDMSFGDRQVKMDFKGKLEGETLTGEFTSERGVTKASGKKIAAGQM